MPEIFPEYFICTGNMCIDRTLADIQLLRYFTIRFAFAFHADNLLLLCGKQRHATLYLIAQFIMLVRTLCIPADNGFHQTLLMLVDNILMPQKIHTTTPGSSQQIPQNIGISRQVPAIFIKLDKYILNNILRLFTHHIMVCKTIQTFKISHVQFFKLIFTLNDRKFHFAILIEALPLIVIHQTKLQFFCISNYFFLNLKTSSPEKSPNKYFAKWLRILNKK